MTVCECECTCEVGDLTYGGYGEGGRPRVGSEERDDGTARVSACRVLLVWDVGFRTLILILERW